MSWVAVSEISTWTGQAFTSAESLRAQMVIDMTEALVIAYCRGKVFGPSPGADVKAVVVNEVARTLNANPGVLSENIGEIHTQYSAFRFGLSADAKTILRQYRRNRLGSISAKGGGLAV